MKYKSLILLFTIIFSFNYVFSQKNLLQSGPMIGYSEMLEVMLWAQTTKEAKVKIIYYNINKPDIKHSTNTVSTNKNNGFTAHLIADKLEPGQIYNYDLYINNKKISFDYKTQFKTQKIWKWREDAPDFSFASGSGTYINEEKYDRPGKGYGGN